MNQPVFKTIRNIAIVGPYSSGKTTLLESLLSVTQSITRKGSIKDGNTVGDNVPEARDRKMTVEISAASLDYADIHFTFLDCPGSIEFAQETYNALVGAGAAIVVCEPEIDRVLTLAPLFKFLDDWEIPHLLFINKMDRAKNKFMDVLHALKSVSTRPLLPLQYPIWQDQNLIGYIDLISEQAYHYHAHSPADPVPLPPHLKVEEQEARQELLETLAEFDDHLLEELLEEIEPPQDEILQDLKKELGADQIVPVLLGIAEQDYGVRPLLNALLQEAPEPEVTAKRRGFVTEVRDQEAQDQTVDQTVVQILKTYFTQQGGRLSLVRVWQGEVTDGLLLNGVRAGGIYRMLGSQQQLVGTAQVGEIVAIGRLDGLQTGDTLTSGTLTSGTLISSGTAFSPLPKADLPQPVFAQAIAPENRKDEVKLSNALHKLIEEDPALSWEQETDTREILLWGQGEIHLQVTLDRLRRKYHLPMTSRRPRVPYKETLRQSTQVHGRYKHQSGGHGAFGDVYLDIKPLSRGTGFIFQETIVGGVVPKQYIPGVEMGVREYLEKGPLGFPLVDLEVTLTHGSYHTVDSSEQAFKQAARMAMTEGVPRCQPILLEPILRIEVAIPTDFTSKALQLVSGRRGQILGYEGRDGWKDWDLVSAYLPQGEMHDFIVELRSLTLGVGTFHWQNDHLQEVPDKLMSQVLATTTLSYKEG